MTKKYAGIIYTVCIIVILIILSIMLRDNASNILSGNDDKTLASNDDNENPNITDDNWRYSEERADILEKICEIDATSAIINKGTYPGNPDSIEINKEFLVDDYTIWDPIDGYELEFLSYEELDNISDYIESDGIIEDEWKACTEYNNYINEDGTLNKIDIPVKKYDSNDWITIEDYELVAIKLKVKIKNIENNKNEIFMGQFSPMKCCIMMDNDKLYEYLSFYRYKETEPITARALYHSFMDKVYTDEMTYPDIITLEPLEVVEGEFIYIVGKQDIEYLYIATRPNNREYYWFNASYIEMISVSKIKERSNN